MARFNTTATKPRVRAGLTGEAKASGRTYNGDKGYAVDAKSELFKLAVANFVGQGSFYENTSDRDARFEELAAKVAIADGVWFEQFVRWLRGEGNMRTASLVLAAEGVKARLAAKTVDGASNRSIIDAALLRADEPGEMLGYWTSKNGRAIPKPIKRGVADAATRLYNEFSLLKNDTNAKGYRFADVIELTHVDPNTPWQSDLFKHAIERRHKRDEMVIPETLRMIKARTALDALPKDEAKALLLGDNGSQVMKDAGLTWEALPNYVGAWTANAWEKMIPNMGYMALLRNLRNFDREGISEQVRQLVIDRLSDPEQVAKSRQLPMRFLSAYKELNSVWYYPALEKALTLSLNNIPELDGNTLILVDRSQSMFGRISEKSGLDNADAAAIFGSAIAMRAKKATLVQYGTTSSVVSLPKGSSLLKAVKKFGDLGGTNTFGTLRQHFTPEFNRVILLTDEQAGWGFSNHDIDTAIPSSVPMYTWNLAGYGFGHTPANVPNRYTFAGLTDQSFGAIKLLEQSKDSSWPWLNK